MFLTRPHLSIGMFCVFCFPAINMQIIRFGWHNLLMTRSIFAFVILFVSTMIKRFSEGKKIWIFLTFVDLMKNEWSSLAKVNLRLDWILHNSGCSNQKIASGFSLVKKLLSSFSFPIVKEHKKLSKLTLVRGRGSFKQYKLCKKTLQFVSNHFNFIRGTQTYLSVWPMNIWNTFGSFFANYTKCRRSYKDLKNGTRFPEGQLLNAVSLELRFFPSPFAIKATTRPSTKWQK